jgi:hypothetical protein
MRKITGTVLLLAVMYLCTPAFGNYFLLYDVSAPVTGVDFFYLESAVKVPLKGYMLLTLSDANAFVDVNLVLYGNNASGEKKYVILNYHGDSYLSPITTSTFYGYFDIRLVGDSPFDFTTHVLGKLALKDVGLGASAKKNIAPSLKGVINVPDGMLLDSRQSISGTGTVTMKLNSSMTKAINDTDPTWTAQQVIEGQVIGSKLKGIIPNIEAKGYEDASPTPP